MTLRSGQSPGVKEDRATPTALFHDSDLSGVGVRCNDGEGRVLAVDGGGGDEYRTGGRGV